jgi:hypothetical protein
MATIVKMDLTTIVVHFVTNRRTDGHIHIRASHYRRQGAQSKSKSVPEGFRESAKQHKKIVKHK